MAFSSQIFVRDAQDIINEVFVTWREPTHRMRVLAARVFHELDIHFIRHRDLGFILRRRCLCRCRLCRFPLGGRFAFFHHVTLLISKLLIFQMRKRASVTAGTSIKLTCRVCVAWLVLASQGRYPIRKRFRVAAKRNRIRAQLQKMAVEWLAIASDSQVKRLKSPNCNPVLEPHR